MPSTSRSLVLAVLVCGCSHTSEPWPSLDDLACSDGEACASEGPFLEGTCCAVGETLPEVGLAAGREVLSVQVDDAYTYACGGFGLQVDPLDATDQWEAEVSPRCQHVALGPVLSDGTRVLYLTHHGDSLIPTPFLQTWHLTPDRELVEVARQASAVVYGGVDWDADVLVATVHDVGVEVYATDAAGLPVFQSRFDRHDRAIAVAVEGRTAFVADQTSLTTLDLTDLTAPRLTHTLQLAGSGRAVALSSDAVWVAIGANGVHVFERVSGGIEDAGAVHTGGSAQGVAVDGDYIAVAAWTHVQLRRADDMQLLGTRRLRPWRDFEQDLAVAVAGDRVYAGEWDGLHVLQYQPGHVGPDLWLPHGPVAFPQSGGTVTFPVINRGTLPLSVTAASSSAEIAVVPSHVLVEPAATAELAVSWTPPAPAELPLLLLTTDDPDPHDAAVEVPLHIAPTDLIGVGDSIDESFAFLDPTGERSLASLQGHVIFPAYFALF